MASQSAAVRAEKAIEGDIAEGLAAQNPIVAMAMQAFPKLGKTLRRNPELVDVVLAKLASKVSVAPGNGATSASPKFKLGG